MILNESVYSWQNKVTPPIVPNTISNHPITPQSRPEQRNLIPVTQSIPCDSCYQAPASQQFRGKGGRGENTRGGNRGGPQFKQQYAYID